MTTQERVYKKHWIIESEKKGRIWASFNSYAEARTELDQQISSLKEGQTKGDWKIVEMRNQHQHFEAATSKADKDYESF